jgi:hypothetical protein
MNPAKTPTQLRLTHDLLERADALIAVMAADPEVRVLGMPTRTAVLRLAIARGLRDLEGQYQQPTPAPRRPSRPEGNRMAARLMNGLLSALHLDPHSTQLEALRDPYLAAAHTVTQFTQDAERMEYPQCCVTPSSPAAEPSRPACAPDSGVHELGSAAQGGGRGAARL